MKELHDRAGAQNLALATVDTHPEALAVIDDPLCLLGGSRCLYEILRGPPAKTPRRRSLFDVSGAQRGIPGTRQFQMRDGRLWSEL